MRAGMLIYRMNSSSGAGNRRNYAYILNTTRDFSSHNPEQSNSEFYLRFLTSTSVMLTRLSSVLSTARSLRRLPIVILCLALLGVTVYPIPRGGCDHVSNAHGGCTVYPIFAMLLSWVYRVPFPSQFLSILRLSQPSYRFQPFRCRVCRPFQAFVFHCYRCYRHSPCGLPSSVSVFYRRCHAASNAILILLVSAVLRHVDSISSVVFYLPYDVPTLPPLPPRIVRYSLPLRSRFRLRHLLLSLLSLSLLLLSGIVELGFMLLSQARRSSPLRRDVLSRID